MPQQVHHAVVGTIPVAVARIFNETWKPDRLRTKRQDMAEISFETGPNTRIVEARQAIRRAMPDIAPYRRVGLMTYGPGAGGACANVDLRFGPVENAAEPVIAAIDGLQPDCRFCLGIQPFRYRVNGKFG